MCFQWTVKMSFFYFCYGCIGKVLQFLDVFLGICEHAPDKNNQCHRIFEVLNSTGSWDIYPVKTYFRCYLTDWGPGYTDTFSFENTRIFLYFHLLFTRKQWKRSWKRKHANTQSKVDGSENATKRKWNDLKTHPCNRDLIRVQRYLNLEATKSEWTRATN